MVKNFIVRFIFLVFVLSLSTLFAQAQTCPCEASVPTYTVDLSGSPVDSVILEDLARNGLCCGITGSTKCIKFIVILHPNTSILEFDYLGAPASDYMINCTEPHPIRDPVCVVGLDTFCITYCKPGGNVGDYKIKGSYLVQASPDITVASGCSAEISVAGLEESSIIWNTIYPGGSGDYNSYLDCTTGCDTLNITPTPGYPPYIDIEVTGTQESVCNTLNTRDTVRVNFVDSRAVEITPSEPSICFGESDVTLTANATGGAPPYTYTWSNSVFTASNTVATAGQYIVEVADTTACPPIYDTVTVVEHLANVSVEAGDDTTLCTSSPTYTLQGSVIQASGGYWWGGNGTFTPDSSALNAGYTPTPGEIAAGSIWLKLTTTGNGSCNAQTDSVLLSFALPPTATITGSFDICETDVLSLSAGEAQASNYTSLYWSTSGSGSFTNGGTLTPEYSPSATDISNGSVNLILHATGQGACVEATDTLTLTIWKQTLVNAGSDISACVSSPSLNLLGAVSGGSSTGLWSSSGDGYFSPGNTNLLASYIPGDADTANRSATLKLTATNTGSCPATADSLVLTLTDDPYAFAGDDTSYCTNYGSAIQLNGVVNNSGSYSWSSNGDGTFSNPLAISPTYSPGSDDISSGNVIIRLSTSGNGSCQEMQSSFLMIVQQPPQVAVPSDRTLCANNAITSLAGTVTGTSLYQWSSSGTGVFSPNAFTLNPVYYPSSQDTALGTVSLKLSAQNSCAAVDSSLLLYFTPAPFVNAGADLSTCYESTPIPLNGYVSAEAGGGLWTSSGSGNFIPDANTLNAQYQPSSADTASGMVNLVLKSVFNGNCLPVSDTMQLIFQKAANISLSGDTLICNGDTAEVTASVIGGSGSGVWTILSGSGRLFPNNTANPVRYIPHANDLAAGSVLLQYTTLESGNCSPAFEYFRINLKASPVVNAGADQLLCANNANMFLNGTVTNSSSYFWTSSGTGVFSPNHLILQPEYLPSPADTAAGAVYLKLIANDGCVPVADSLLLSMQPAPRVDAGPTVYICSADNVANISGWVSSNVSGGRWTTTGDGLFSNANSLSTTYTLGTSDLLTDTLQLVLTSTGNGLCNPVSDTLLVVKTSVPVVSVNPVLAICGNDSATLNATITNGVNAGVWTSSGDGVFYPSNTTINALYLPGPADETAGSVWLKLTTTQSCVAVSDSVELTVLAAPVTGAGSDLFICETTTIISLSGSATNWAQPVAWSTNGAGSFNPNSNQLTPDYQLTASDQLSDSIAFYIETTNNGSCPPARDTSMVYIEHTPVPVAGTDLTICRGDTAKLTGSLTGGSGTTQWTSRGDGTFLLAIDSLTNEYIPGNADLLAGSVWLVLEANGMYCGSAADSLLLNFNPAHQANAGADATICATQNSVNLNGSFLNATTAFWSGSGSFSPSEFDMNATYTPTAGEISAGNAKLILTTSGVDGCTPDRDTVEIFINPPPFVEAGSNIFLCKGADQVTLTGTISGSVNTGTWSASGIGSFNPSATSLNTIYTLTAADTSAGFVKFILESDPPPVCSAVKDSLMLYLTDIPTVNAGPDDTLCANVNSVSLNGTIGNGFSAGTWSAPSGNGTFSPSRDSLQTNYQPGNLDISNGRVNLVLTATQACVLVRDTLELIITPAPVVIIPDTIWSCENEAEISVSATVSGGASAGIWSTGGDGSFANNLQNTTNYTPGTNDTVSGSVWVYLETTDHGNCLPAKDSTLIVFSKKPQAFIFAPDSVCVMAPTELTSMSVSLNGALHHRWTINSSTYTDSLIQHSFSLPGWNTIRLIATNHAGCADTTTRNIYVSTGPTSQFSISQECTGDTLSFSNLSVNSTSWEWYLGDNLVSNALSPSSLIPDTAGRYVFSLVAYNALGCADSTAQEYSIYNKPNPDFIFSAACQQTFTSFTDASSVLNDTLESWSWDFGDGSFSTQKNPGHAYGLLDTARVSLLVSTDKCTNRVEKVIPLIPYLEITSDKNAGCTPLQINLTSNQDATSVFQWNLGNGNVNSDPNPQVSYSNYTNSIRTYQIIAEVENPAGCLHKDTLDIEVHPSPNVQFTQSANNICPGDTVTLINLTANTGTTRWKINNSELSEQDSIVPVILQNSMPSDVYYTARLIVENNFGCIDSTENVIGVFGKPDINITPSLDSICNNTSVRWSASQQGISYLWNFGDGKTAAGSQTVFHYYNMDLLADSLVDVNLLYTDQNYCKDTAYNTIMVIPAPIPGFTLSQAEGCSPMDVNFADTSLNAVTASWNFGDSSPESTGSNTSHTFINSIDDVQSFLITLNVSNSFGCEASAEDVVYVYNQPVSEFTCDTFGCSPLQAYFNNISSGANRYSWQFGDGIISTQKNPSHTYLNHSDIPRTFNARLISWSVYNCSDTSAYQPIVVNPVPTARFNLSASGGCTPLNVTATIQDNQPGDSWIWKPSTESNTTYLNELSIQPSYSNSSDAVENDELWLYLTNSYQCTDSVNEIIEIYPAVRTSFSVNDSIGCTPFDLIIDNTTTDSANFSWNFGDGKTSEQLAPVHTYYNSGESIRIYNLQMVAYSEYLCSDSVTKRITVYPSPEANFEPSVTAGCSPLTIALADSTKGALRYRFEPGDGRIFDSVALLPSISYLNNSNTPDNFDMKLTAISAYGCEDTVTQNLVVYPGVEASFDHIKSGCSPLEVTFNNTSDHVFQYEWTYGDGAVSGLRNPVHAYLNEGTEDIQYTIELIISSHFGCKDTSYSTLDVYAKPDPDFEVDPSYQVFPNATVTLNNLTSGDWQYEWDFGDNSTSVEKQPGSHTYSKWGEYIIILHAYDNQCSDTVSHPVRLVLGSPTADYDSSFSGCVPLTVSFTNKSINAEHYQWYFGDGGTSDDVNPKYTYRFPGTYTVELFAKSIVGEDFANHHTVEVYPLPATYFQYAPHEVAAGEEVMFINKCDNAVEFLWDFGDGSSSEEYEPVHTYDQAGTYNLALISVSDKGCIDTFSIDDALIVTPGCFMEFPNAFTPIQDPSSDGYFPEGRIERDNNIFHPLFRNISDYKLEVYNRWGEHIYTSNDPEYGWTGYYEGKPSPEGVYIYNASATCLNGDNISRSGTITLIW